VHLVVAREELPAVLDAERLDGGALLLVLTKVSPLRLPGCDTRTIPIARRADEVEAILPP
jgi:hypothetical protein